MLTVYVSDVTVKRSRLAEEREGGGPRGRITHLSPAARRRLVLYARNLREVPEVTGVVTYWRRWPRDGRELKRHLDRLLKRLVRRGWAGLWVLEFQTRGAPHVHLWLSRRNDFGEAVEGRDYDLEEERRWLVASWAAVIDEHPDAIDGGQYFAPWQSGRHGLQDYVAKEAAKWYQKEVPADFENVGRFYGLFGGASVERREVYASRESLAPSVRVARGAERADRRDAGLKPRKDKGRAGFTAYGAAGAVARWLGEEGLG